MFDQTTNTVTAAQPTHLLKLRSHDQSFFDTETTVQKVYQMICVHTGQIIRQKETYDKGSLSNKLCNEIFAAVFTRIKVSRQSNFTPVDGQPYHNFFTKLTVFKIRLIRF